MASGGADICVSSTSFQKITSAVEATEVNEAAEVLRPGKSQLRTSE